MTKLFGYVFNITIVTALMNVFLTLKIAQAEHALTWIMISIAAVMLSIKEKTV